MVDKVMQGDIVILSLDPSKGSEQKGQRPAVVVSVDDFNHVQKMIFICPITQTDRNYPTHVRVVSESSIQGFVMCEQMRSVDYKVRILKRVGRLNTSQLSKVLSIINALLMP